jgi:hypothetical protein
LGAGAGTNDLGPGTASDPGRDDGTGTAVGTDNGGGADGTPLSEWSGSPSASGSSPNRESASERASASTGNWDRAASVGHVKSDVVKSHKVCAHQLARPVG